MLFFLQLQAGLSVSENNNFDFNSKSYTDSKIVETGGKKIVFYEKSSNPKTAHFFDRKSEVLLVVLPGFNNVSNHYAQIAEWFPAYDILLFNYRFSILKNYPDNQMQLVDLVKFATTLRPLRDAFDVLAVLAELEDQTEGYKKTYKKKICVGFCFGAVVAIKNQGPIVGLEKFDALWLDSPWNSLESIASQIFRPEIFCSKETLEANSLSNHLVENILKDLLLKDQKYPDFRVLQD